MTCFWDAIMAKLPLIHIHKYLDDAVSDKISLIVALKTRAAHVLRECIDDVTWSDAKLSTQEVAEHIQWITQYNIDEITNGHDTSVCDPFLVFICHIFLYDIDHEYNGVIIRYRNTNNRDISKRLHFASDRGHMW